MLITHVSRCKYFRKNSTKYFASEKDIYTIFLCRFVGFFAIFKWAWSAQCIGRVHPECGESFRAYNSTFYPNLLGQWTADESKTSFSQFYPLRQMECSKHLDLFLCSTLSPACVNDELSGKLKKMENYWKDAVFGDFFYKIWPHELLFNCELHIILKLSNLAIRNFFYARNFFAPKNLFFGPKIFITPKNGKVLKRRRF